MAEQQTKPPKTSVTITIANDETDARLQPEVARVKLKLRKPKSGKKVNWSEETVDNEHLDKKKSKCCCIYHKPRAPDESSSSEDEECEHCHGHVEKKKIKAQETSSPPQEESSTKSMVVA